MAAAATYLPVPPPVLNASIQENLPEGLGQNGGRVSTEKIGFLRPTPVTMPVDEMRQRLKQDGYLFVKGLIPRRDVLDARENYFGQYLSTSFLEPGSSPRDGIFNSSSDPDSHKGIGGNGLPVDQNEERILIDAHKNLEYRAFVEHPSLTGFITKIMNWRDHQILDRTMLRHNVPFGKGTGIHYDKLFLRGGDGFFLTAWVPIGDISINGGGLCYLENSVPLGRAIEDEFNKRAEFMTEEERISAFNVNMVVGGGMISHSPQEFQEMHSAHGVHKWLVTNYEAGDVVFHDPYSIHASGRNEDPTGRIRLSTDLRFYEKGDPNVDKRWFKIWTPDDGL
ncbi:hypothetical protein N7454_008273 [Penicillium verhagenii]|nr:hypothetical protein N7454_008273 [Penicillium verhagenii]